MNEVSYSENTVVIGNDEVQVRYDVKDIVVVDDVVVVLQEPPADADDVERNIVAFDTHGTQLWTVQQASRGHPTPRTYTYIRYENGELIANNWNGYKYTVDIEDGSITKYKKYMK